MEPSLGGGGKGVKMGEADTVAAGPVMEGQILIIKCDIFMQIEERASFMKGKSDLRIYFLFFFACF